MKNKCGKSLKLAGYSNVAPQKLKKKIATKALKHTAETNCIMAVKHKAVPQGILNKSIFLLYNMTLLSAYFCGCFS